MSNRYQRALVCFLIALICREVVGSDAGIVVRRRSDAPVVAYQRVELDVQLNRQYRNPFDPDEIAVDAQVTGPDGKHLIVPGFWGQDFPNTFTDSLGIKAAASGPASFRVRFCPTCAGRWSVVVSAQDKEGSRIADPIGIEVAPSGNRGFIRVAPANRRYLQFDSGAPYFPIGLNLCWTNGNHESQFIGWFDQLSKAGGNFARVWMCHPPVRIENEIQGIGRYDLRNAAYFDDLLELAERNGIEVMLTFTNHREFLDHDMWGDGGWATNPYNAENGGPAKTPIECFTNPKARKFYRHRLRYLIARYCAFTNVACWELFNEQENARLKDLPLDWNAQMAGYLKTHDPYDHLVSTSAAVPGDVWKIDAMSITQSHLYGDGDNDRDLVMPAIDAPRKHAQFDKPHFEAECGITYKKPDLPYDPNHLGTSLHNSLWASTMSGACGAAAYWWWDNYIDPANVWGQFAPVSKFAATIDWSHAHFTSLLLRAPQMQSAGQETFSDLVINSVGAGAWGKAGKDPITILRSGQTSAALPFYIFGPGKADLRTQPTLVVDMPQAGNMALHIAKVSDLATLCIRVDNTLKKVCQYDASPGMPDHESTATTPQDRNVYQAVVNADQIVPLPAGKHTIVFDMTSGDWLGLDRITFDGAKSSRCADLGTVTLQDKSDGETLVWLYDATSNWQNDQNERSGRELRDVLLTVPVPRSGIFDISWWDTRTGAIAAHQTAGANEGLLSLTAPPFHRDIALRITTAVAK